MHKHLHTFISAISAFAMALLLFFSGAAILYSPRMQGPETVKTISDWNMEGTRVSLPTKIKDLAPRTSLTLTAQIRPGTGDYIYLKTVYAPLKVFADNELVFEYGQPGSYPSFLLDPPTKTALFPLPASGKTITLRMEYSSPSQRDTLALYPVLTGSSTAILSRLFANMGFSLFFSMVLIALGIILWLIALVLTRFERNGIAFFHLGLFTFCVGIWALGECNLTGIFFQHPSLLYVMAFLGLFTTAIPIINFGLAILNLHTSRPLKWMRSVLELCVCTAILLQIGGIVSFARSMYLFHLLIPLALCLFAACIFIDSIRYQNPIARRFLIPLSVLALFSLLEVANYYMFNFNVQKSFFFQIGVMVFVFMVSALCGYFIRDIFALRSNNCQLSYKVSMMEKQVEIQKTRHQFLSETSALVRQQRHDLKHHIAVIRSFLAGQETEKLMDYLDELSAKIPEEPFQTLCQNEAVNAVALHYHCAALKSGITPCSITLDIPKETGKVPESDLCVIVGNLLENAVAACKLCDKPFICMKSRVTGSILTITMDNSCTGAESSPDGNFLSKKTGGGIGLASIRSVAEKYGGGCCFEVKNGVFSSSVYLYLK